MVIDPALDLGLYAFPDVDRPWLRTNFVTTLDGAAHDVSGVTASLGGDTDTELFAYLRSIADVVLVGAGTARIENYGPKSTVPIAIASRRLDIPERLQAPGVVVVTTTDAPAERVDELTAAGVEIMAHGDITVDWPGVLASFAARGWLKINCEGGPSLHGELISNGLVDDLCLTIAPVLTAGDATRIAHSRLPVAEDMRLAHVVPVGDVLFTRWTRIDQS
ncbi:MAG TPA: dihydrofolate reductase family protein [Aeromicrobium sp.]|nr:dihydrofolate reductase family protein [Aeromicrobium sp.]